MTEHSPLISICIPTYDRVELLDQAIASAFRQTYAPIQIVVSDDSSGNDTATLVATKYCNKGIKYKHNCPPLGQAENVNQLFDMADGNRLVLLHDDDLLLPNALVTMDRVWRDNPDLTLCYGKQMFMDANGTVLDSLTVDANTHYHRLSVNHGRQNSEVLTALIQQVPSDGYMISTEAARKTRMNSDTAIGGVCDYDFSLRLASQNRGFYFVDSFTACYRLNPNSLTSQGVDVHLSFDMLQAFDLPQELQPVRYEKLSRIAPVAVTRWLRQGNVRAAGRVYFSKYYSAAQRLKPKGLTQLMLLALPAPALKWLFRSQ